MKFSKTLLAALIVGATSASFAATTVPNTFTSGSPASASQVNANFSALATAIDSLTTRVAKLEGSRDITAADISGTYNMLVYVTEIGTSHVGLSQTMATVTLTAGNKVSFSCKANSEHEVQPNAMYGKTDSLNGKTDFRPFLTSTGPTTCDLPSDNAVSWSYDANSKILSLSGLNVSLMPAGKGLLIGKTTGSDTGTLDDGSTPKSNFSEGLMILVRQ